MSAPYPPVEGLQPLDTATLSEELTRLIRATPGIVAVYNAGAPAQTLLKTVADATRKESRRERLVDLTQDAAGLIIAVIIGIDRTEPAAVVGRRVHASIREHLDITAHLLPARVRVKIGRVD
jgi:hypothetical protein